MRKAVMSCLTQDELRRLMAYMQEHDPQMHAICLLAMSHGMRRNEVLNLTIHNFVDGRVIFGRLKGSQPSNHKLIDHPDPVFNEPMALGPVLKIRSDGRVLFDIDERQVNRLLVRYGKACGIHRSACHIHTFKHVACTYLLPALGVDGLVKYVGFSAEQNALKYIKPTEAAVEARLDAAIGGT
jgi:integrase